MALSGSCGNTFRTGYRLQIDWTATQNIANNTSTVTAKLYLISLGASYYINASAYNTNHIYLDGTTYSNTSTSALSGNEKRLLFTTSKTITHNSDGTKTFSLGGDRYMNVTLSGVFWGTVTISNTNFTLDTIPRASIINHVDTLSNVSGSTELDVVPNMTVYSTSFNLDFTLKIGSTSIKTWSDITVGSTGTQNLKLSLSAIEQDNLMSYMKTVTSATLTLTCQTQSGSTNIGSLQSKTFTADLDVSTISPLNPTFDTISATENDSYASALGIGFIQGLSEIVLSMTNCSTKKSSSISSYKIIYNNISYNSQNITTPTIGWTSTSVTAILTDSRGLTCSKTVNLTATAYASPVFTNLSVKRINADGSSNDLGVAMQISISGSITSLNSKNQYNYAIYARIKGTSDWGTALESGTGTIGDTAFNLTDIISSISFDAAKSYDIKVTFSDKFNVTILPAVLSTGVVVMSLGEIGVGVGKIWEQGALDVGGDAYISNDLHVSNFIENIKSTQNTGASYANYVARILSINITKQYEDAMIGGVLYNYGDGNSILDCANFNIRVKQQAAMGSAPYVDMHLQNNRGYFDVYAVLISNTSSLTQVDVYVKILSAYRTILFSPVFKSGSIEAFSNETLISALPSGTQYTADKNIYEDGSTLGNKYLKSGQNTLLMCNNDGFYYDDSTNIMYVTKDGTNHIIWDNTTCPFSASSSGYQKLASGIMVQWGTSAKCSVTSNDSAGYYGHCTATFPTAFPTSCDKIVWSTSSSSCWGTAYGSQTTTSVTLYFRAISSLTAYGYFIAIGH